VAGLHGHQQRLAERALANLPKAMEAASVALLLDNDRIDEPYRFVARFHDGQLVHGAQLAPSWASMVLR
jgi:hypothetical protein